jgi:hypothetical protein
MQCEGADPIHELDLAESTVGEHVLQGWQVVLSNDPSQLLQVDINQEIPLSLLRGYLVKGRV